MKSSHTRTETSVTNVPGMVTRHLNNSENIKIAILKCCSSVDFAFIYSLLLFSICAKLYNFISENLNSRL